jgi:hypothetical protein
MGRTQAHRFVRGRMGYSMIDCGVCGRDRDEHKLWVTYAPWVWLRTRYRHLRGRP